MSRFLKFERIPAGVQLRKVHKFDSPGAPLAPTQAVLEGLGSPALLCPPAGQASVGGCSPPCWEVLPSLLGGASPLVLPPLRSIIPPANRPSRDC